VLWAAAELALPSFPPSLPPSAAEGQQGQSTLQRGDAVREMCRKIAAAAAVGAGGGTGAGVGAGEGAQWHGAGAGGDGWTVQGASTTLWAMGVLGIASSPLADELLLVVKSQTHMLQDSEFCQLHQVCRSVL